MSEVIRLPPRLRVVASRDTLVIERIDATRMGEPIVLPPPPRVMDAERRIALFRGYVLHSDAAAIAEGRNQTRLAAHLRAEAARLLEASRT